MTPDQLSVVRQRLEAFAADVFTPLVRSDQRAKGETYLRGLLLDGRRKSMQPMADRLGVDHQGLQQFVTTSTWDTTAVRMRLAARAVGVKLLRRRLPPPPRLDVVLSEAVLRVAGGPATMAAQLRHLREVTALPHVSVRVLPLAVGLPDGAEAGSFTLLEFPFVSRAVPEVPVVYQESVTGALYLDRPAELAAFERAWASIGALALDPDQSRRLIGKIAEQVHGG